ncbi:MAG: lipase family alpha/beta hydrolase [Myxococcota bacterium]
MRALPFLCLLVLACGREAAVVVPAAETMDAGDVEGASLTTDAGVDAGVVSPPPPAPHGAPYPVVFVHGMAGFDAIRIGGLSMDYFGNTVQDLQARGEQAWRVVLPPFDSSEARAQELAKQLTDILRATGSAKVNLIAHSQGGLDARLLISPAGLGWGDRVATLVTVSTPHRGTKAANVFDRAAGVLPDDVADALLDGLAGLLERTAYEVQNDPHLRAQLHDLTEDAATAFNRKYLDDPRVRYLSWAGRSNLRAGLEVCDGATYDNEPLKLDVLLPVFFAVAVATEWGFPPEVSDGLVTVKSAKWGTFQGCVPADHLDEVGMPNVNGADLSIFDSKQFYRDVVAELRTHGH